MDMFIFVRNGKSIKQTKGESGIPITRIETISNGVLDRSRLGYAGITNSSLYKDYFLRNGDILMSHINSPVHIGKSALCEDIQNEEEIIHGMNLLCLRPVKVENAAYLQLFFQTESFHEQISPYIKNAVNQASINTGNLGHILLPIPPAEEQQRIINEYDRIQQWIDFLDSDLMTARGLVNKAKAIILSYAIMGKLVPQDPSDEPAIEILKRINPNFKPCDNSHYPFEIPDSWVFASGKDIFLPMKSTKPSGDEFFYIDIDSVDNKNNVIHSPKRVKTENAPSRASRFTKKGDVVFSMVRPYLRNIAAVRENGCIASTGFFVCSPNKSIHTDYMFLMMLSSYVIDGLNQFMKGDNSPSINTDNILSWKYPVPPLNEQRRIVVEVQRLYQCLEQIETHLTK